VARRQLTLDNTVAAELAGSEDTVLRALRGRLEADLHLRGNVLTLEGDPDEVAAAATVVDEMVELIEQGHDVAPGTIDPTRVAVIRGAVFDASAQPLPGVRITVLDHPELGQTLSRADGKFDLAVNGGGLLVVRYEKAGLLPAQRQVDVPPQDYVMAPDVMLIARTAKSRFVVANVAAPVMYVLVDVTSRCHVSGRWPPSKLRPFTSVTASG
jgi:hypothetical protein